MRIVKIEQYAKYTDSIRLLERSNYSVSSEFTDRLNAHLAFIETRGRAFGVVSGPDISRGAYDHVIDSMSLIPYLQEFAAGDFGYIDIGTGGGFPGLVCASAFPDARFVLIDRSKKKCAFLRLCVGGLSLPNVEIFDSSFAEYPFDLEPVVAMVRGLERAEETVPELVGRFSVGSVCFWMTGEGVDARFGSRFHVEQIVDEWCDLGLRRGVLFKISVGDKKSSGNSLS